ncbi:MAG: hypothetical protein AB1797_05150 [bacterium]
MLDARCWMLDARYSILYPLSASRIQHRASRIEFGAYPKTSAALQGFRTPGVWQPLDVWSLGIGTKRRECQ